MAGSRAGLAGRTPIQFLLSLPPMILIQRPAKPPNMFILGYLRCKTSLMAVTCHVCPAAGRALAVAEKSKRLSQMLAEPREDLIAGALRETTEPCNRPPRARRSGGLTVVRVSPILHDMLHLTYM